MLMVLRNKWCNPTTYMQSATHVVRTLNEKEETVERNTYATLVFSMAHYFAACNVEVSMVCASTMWPSWLAESKPGATSYAMRAAPRLLPRRSSGSVHQRRALSFPDRSRRRCASQAAASEEEFEVLDAESGRVRCAANYAPLTPLSFIERAAAVYGDRPAVVYGETWSCTWREVRERCVCVAAALATRFGIARGDVVSN
ncbi:putative acyl-CoA synthetase YngI [Hordeum vulgare]|nr:putative acyl-CoA synthetase YngI [Hordeum vulgare]